MRARSTVVMLDRPPARPPPKGRRTNSEIVGTSSRRARQRAYRQRVANGQAIAPVRYDADVLTFLIATHWLAEADAADRRKVGDAIARMLAASARR
jgi:hypothetical protein